MPICYMTLELGADLIDILLDTSLNFDEVRERGSDIIKKYYTTEKFRDFSFTINLKHNTVTMKGSWAKFHNKGLHNYTPYTTADLQADIRLLSDSFDFDFSQGIIHGVEAGVNLNLSGFPQSFFSPDQLISRLISYQGRVSFVPMKSIRGAGSGVEASLTNYRLKFYDKGTQFHLPYPLVRFEFDCNQMIELRSIDIHRLVDLTNSHKLHLLGQKIQKQFADCILTEPMEEKALSVAQSKLIQQAERPIFWKNLAPRNRAYYLQQFRSLRDTNSVHQVHETLNAMIKDQWSELTNIYPLNAY